MTKEQFQSVIEWQKKTFGEATTMSKLNHLAEEIIELIDAVDSHDGTPEHEKEQRLEFADCFLLLFGAANAAGMTYEDIVKCCNDKMEINRSRKWGKPQANGVVNHIRE